MSGGVGQEDSVPVKEVLLTGLGHKNSRPTLIAFVEQDLLIYEAFTFTEASVEGHLNLRFRKVCLSTSLNPLSYVVHIMLLKCYALWQCNNKIAITTAVQLPDINSAICH